MGLRQTGNYIDREQGLFNIDTYTEQLFFEQCRKNTGKIKIFYEWQANKEKYVRMTDTAVYDFQNYSLHDQSHSQAIIHAIEKFLGRRRLEKLRIGDLWMLLNAAYGHDTGMYVKNDEIIELWRDNEEFHEMLNNMANQPELHYQKEARYYFQLHNMLSGKDAMDGLEGEEHKIVELTRDWPLQVKKNIMILTNEYIRKHHTERAQKFFEEFSDSIGIKIAEERLYKVLGKVVYAHGEEFEYIFNNLQYRADGFGDDKVHPRFIAAMLRLGDLLDMDNNRFDIYTLQHFGELPSVSRAHLKKHLALSHLNITQEYIEAEERADEIITCEYAAHWFRMLEEEIDNIVKYWNSIAPKEIGGCVFREKRLHIFLRGKEYKIKQQDKFQVDEKKFIDVLIGDKLYDDSLVFIREYIQNAMDATKVLYGLKIQDEWKHNAYLRELNLNREHAPLELNPAYLEELTIEVEFKITEEPKEGEKLCITFRDSGIGMDEECFNTLRIIGTGWRGRKKYQKDIQKLADWLRPTGGFGIGLQAGFMITNKVEICSTGLREGIGHEVTITTPREGGEIRYLECDNNRIGAEISLKLNREKFWNYLNGNDLIKNERKLEQWDFFNTDKMLECVVGATQKYINSTIPNCLFPIVIKSGEKEGRLIEEKVKGRIYSALKDENADYIYDNEYQCDYVWLKENENAVTREKLGIWNREGKVYCEISLSDYGVNNQDDCICYRGIRIKNYKASANGQNDKLIGATVNLFLDLYGATSMDWLLISRSGFKPQMEEKIEEIGRRMFRFYLKRLYEKLQQEENGQTPLKTNECLAFLQGYLLFGEEEMKYEKILSASKNINVYKWEKDSHSGKVQTKVFKIPFGKVYKKFLENKPILWRGVSMDAEDQIAVSNLVNISYTENPAAARKIVENEIMNMLGDKDEDAFVISDVPFCRFLDEVRSEDKSYFRIARDEGISRDGIGLLECRKEKKTKEAWSLSEILQKSVNKNDSYIIINEGCSEYQPLFVHKLPVSFREEEKERDTVYILMPYSASFIPTIKEKLQKEKETGFTWEDFWNQLIKCQEWKRVIEWVMSHSEKYYPEKEIKDQYKRFCEMIYGILTA